jgi:hypothetical protein
VKYETASSFRAAIEDRLRLTFAQGQTRSISRQRKLMVFDRLLARLQTAAPDQWVVKGAVALDFRLGPRARATKDLDLARQEDEEAATADLRAAQSLDLGDYFTFKIDRTGALDDMLEGTAVRYRVQADLAGRRFEIVTVDVGFATWLDLPHDHIKGPDFFTFAGIEPVEVLALPLEQHAAEKLHAYTRVYAENRHSTRVKDLVDLVLISSTAELEARQLRRAIDLTFTSRNTQIVPEFFPEPPESWVAPYRRLASEIGLLPNIADGHRSAAAFLDPILSGKAPNAARWDPGKGAWKPPHDTASSC